MFQVEPVLWLQSLESPGLTWLMTTVTSLGYTPVYAVLLIVLVFGMRLREGMFVFVALIMGGMLTHGFKTGLKFPRPVEVDARVMEPGSARPPLIVDGGGADSFWSLPSAESRAASRNQVDGSYGIPSGHVVAATAFFLSIARFFRSKVVLVFSGCWIPLMALSRMYLGRHFVADVMAGLILGVVAVVGTVYLVRPLSTEDPGESRVSGLIPWTLFVVPLVVLSPFVEIFDPEDAGRLLGLLVTYAVILRLGWPTDAAPVWKRSARVLLAVLVYIVIEQVLDPLVESMGLEESPPGMLVVVFLITFVPFAGAILIAQRLRLYGVTPPTG